MRVCLIWPNFDCPVGKSIGLAYLSSALQVAGHTTRIVHISEKLDYPFDPDRIEQELRAFDPGLVGISVAASFYPEMCALGQRLRRALDRPLVLGGIHVTLNTAQVMQENPWLDFACLGEGDDALPELARALESGGDPAAIPNIWTQRGSCPARPLKDITRLPWMDLAGWQFERITQKKRGWVNVMMNRGCPYRCSYCHNEGQARVLQRELRAPSASNAALSYLRFRGIDDMLGELVAIRERYDCVRAFCFCDDTFTMDRARTVEFLERYRDEVRVPFVCMTTVRDVDRELLALVRAAGCRQIRFGVESASPRIRREVIRRGFSTRQIEQAFAWCRELGLRTFAYDMLANPGETRAEMVETLVLNARIRTGGIRPSLGTPYPGTLYHRIAERMGVLESRAAHNYLEASPLRWSDEDRLWIDKLRSFYWWWMNRELGGLAAPFYAGLIELLEALPGPRWADPELRARLFAMDAALSRELQRRDIEHYHTPLADRHEMAFLYSPGQAAVTDEPHR